jgi:hypothetical protein
VHLQRLRHGHPGDTVASSPLAGGGHGRIAVDTDPEHDQSFERGGEPPLTRCALEQHLVDDDPEAPGGHRGHSVVPGCLDRPPSRVDDDGPVDPEAQERWPIGPGGCLADERRRERLDEVVHPERDPRSIEQILQAAGDRRLPRAGAAVEDDHLGRPALRHQLLSSAACGHDPSPRSSRCAPRYARRATDG